jgi:hypothetical protein
MQNREILENGISKIKEGKLANEEKRYAEAIELYTSGCSLLMQVCKSKIIYFNLR